MAEFKPSPAAVDRSDIACHLCQQRIAWGSVIQQRATFQSVPVIRLTFYCEGCDHLVTWTEMPLPGTDIPSSQGVTPCTVIDDCEQVIAFCHAHPRETEVLVA